MSRFWRRFIGHLRVTWLSRTSWSINLVLRAVAIGAIASLCGRLIRAVAAYKRASERTAFQTELSREIHNGVQRLLVTMGARLELASHLIREAPERAVHIVDAERETTRRAADELRYLSRRVRAEAEVDLASALRLQVAATAERWPFDLAMDVPSQLPRLASAAEHAILRVIQESLANAARHARATRVQVRLGLAEGVLRCTIVDDGAGFDPNTTAEDGLEELRNRVQSAGGALHVSAAPGRGVTVKAIFPVGRSPGWRRFGS